MPFGPADLGLVLQDVGTVFTFGAETGRGRLRLEDETRIGTDGRESVIPIHILTLPTDVFVTLAVNSALTGADGTTYKVRDIRRRADTRRRDVLLARVSGP
jgi:hypothetical protein